MSDRHAFDELTKALGAGVSRRTVFGRIAALFGGALLGVFGLPRRTLADEAKLPKDMTAAWTLNSPKIIVLRNHAGDGHADKFICVGTAKFDKVGQQSQYHVVACATTPKGCFGISARDCAESPPNDWFDLKEPKEFIK